jgi:hypothetical protein
VWPKNRGLKENPTYGRVSSFRIGDKGEGGLEDIAGGTFKANELLRWVLFCDPRVVIS